MKKTLTIDHGGFNLTDEQKRILFSVYNNGTIFMDEYIYPDEKNEAEIFQDLVEDGANWELPKEKKKRLKEETRQFINSRSGKFHNRKF